MSLLLDALQRASKDKEKAAVQDAAPTAPPVFLVDLPLVPQTEEPQKVSTWDLPMELTLDLPTPVPIPTPISEPVPPPPHATPLPEALSSVPEPVLVQAPLQPPPQAPQPSPALAPAEPVTGAPRASVSPPGSGRVAQDMRRAYMPASAPTAQRRRTLMYVGLAIAVVVVLAGLGFKMWEDTASLRGASNVVPPNTMAQMPPPDAGVPPTPSDMAAPPGADAPPANLSGPVPVDIEPLPSAKTKAASLPKSSAQAPATKALKQPLVETPAPAAKAAPAVAVAAPVQPPASNQVQVQGTGAKQSFESKMRGPSPLELGYAALLVGRWDDAALHYNQALKANSEERDALLGLAYIAQQKGQRDDAQLLYRRVLRQEPGNAIASSALLALDAEAQGNQSASRARELAMRQPDSAATMSMAGTAAVREGLLADAAQLFARAQFLEPANPMHAYNHAVALDRLGQHAAAAAQYEQVLKLSEKPTAGRSAFSLAAVQERLAQLRQALGSRSDAPK